MNEWTVVTVLSVVVGLFFTVGKPIVKLCADISARLAALDARLTSLDANIDRLEGKIDKFESASAVTHKRIWDHNDEQDEQLQDHNIRLHDLDGK